MTDSARNVPGVLAAQRQMGIWRNRFIALLDRMPVPTAICQLNGTIIASNPALATLFDSTPSQLHGRSILDLVQPKVRRDFDRVLRDIQTGRRTRRALSVYWPERFGELTVQAVADNDGPGLLLTLQPEPLPLKDVPVLTERESEILRLVAGGSTAAATAAELGLTADGVNYHLAKLAERLAVPNRAALIARSYTLGLLDARQWPPG